MQLKKLKLFIFLQEGGWGLPQTNLISLSFFFILSFFEPFLKRVSTCLHGKQVCDAIQVGEAGGAKQIEQGWLTCYTNMYMSQ